MPVDSPEKSTKTSVRPIIRITKENLMPNKNFQWPKISCHHNFFPYPYPQKFAMLVKKDLHMPTNCLHSSWICSTKPIQQNFHNFNAPKIHSTTSQIANIAKIHDSPTLFKLHHAQKIQQFKKCPKAKIKMWPTMQCPKFQQEHTTTKWQCLNIKLSIPNVKFSISSFKFSIPNFQIPNFQFQIFKFQISNFKDKIFFKELQKSIKVFFLEMKKIQIKKEQMETTHIKNSGTTKHSSFKV